MHVQEQVALAIMGATAWTFEAIHVAANDG